MSNVTPFAPTQASVQRPKRLQFPSGIFYSYEGGVFHTHDGSDLTYQLPHFVDTVIQPDTPKSAEMQIHSLMARLMGGEVESIAVSAAQLEAKEKRDRQLARLQGQPDTSLPTIQDASPSALDAPQKAIGSRWMFYPKLAGYGDVWDPGPVVITHHVPQAILKPGSPPRDYIVLRDGGISLFANEASLRALPDGVQVDQATVSQTARTQLATQGPSAPAQAIDAQGRKAVGSSWLFNPEASGIPGIPPVLCKILEQLDGARPKPNSPPRDYRVITTGGVSYFATEDSLSPLEG